MLLTLTNLWKTMGEHGGIMENNGGTLGKQWGTLVWEGHKGYQISVLHAIQTTGHTAQVKPR